MINVTKGMDNKIEFIDSQSGQKIFLKKNTIEQLRFLNQGVLSLLMGKIKNLFFSKKSILIELAFSVFIFFITSSKLRFFFIFLKFILSSYFFIKLLIKSFTQKQMFMGSTILIPKPKSYVIKYLHELSNLNNWNILIEEFDIKSANTFIGSIKIKNKPIKGTRRIIIFVKINKKRQFLSDKRWNDFAKS